MTTLVCGLEESEGEPETPEGHTHDESCYDEEGNLICGQEESEGESEASEGHTHMEDCYETEQVLTCDLEETEGHTHTDACYEEQLVCELEEHTHTVACLSDETADVETEEDWEATLPEDLEGTAAEAVVAIAESQLGYTESTKNFVLADDEETRQGYTRYGAWYGDGFEYVDWDAMFAAFCIHYAGISEEDFPVNSGAYAWAADLLRAGLYADAADYTPEAGDLVFFDTNADGKADKVGIVEAGETEDGTEEDNPAVEREEAEESAVEEEGVVEEEGAAADVISLTVIVGDYSADDNLGTINKNEKDTDAAVESGADAVHSLEVDLGVGTILGYGVLPDIEALDLTGRESADGESAAELEEQTITVTVDDLIVTLSGLLPVKATVSAEPVDLDLEDQEIQFALEISIYDADGNEFEPEDNTIAVTVESENITEDCAIYYVPDEGDMEEIASDSEDGMASFDAEYFSVYVGISTEPASETTYEIYMAAIAEQEEAAYTLEAGNDADVVEIAAALEELLDAAKADLADGNLTQDEYDEIESGIDKPLTWLDDNFDLSWTPDAEKDDAAEEETEEEEEALTVEFTAEADGITVEAWAAEGTFPEGTTMSVTLLSADNEETAQQYEEAIAAIEESEAEYEYDGIVLFDISFFDEDGNEVEPEEGTVSVKVTMDASLVNDDVDETSSLELYHLKGSDDEAEVVTVADTEGLAGGTVDVDEDGTVLAEFSVESFSHFVLVSSTYGSGSYSRWVYLYDENDENQILGNWSIVLGDGVTVSTEWESIEQVAINYIIMAAQHGYIYEGACVGGNGADGGRTVNYIRTTGSGWYYSSASSISDASTDETSFESSIHLLFSEYTAGESTTEEITPSYSKYVSDNNDGTYDLTLTVSGDSTSTVSGKVDIVYILDVSGSMGQELEGTDWGIDDRYERWEAAASAVITLTKAISSDESIDARFSSVIFASNGDGNKETDKYYADIYNELYDANSDGTYNDAVVLQSWTNSATSLIGSLPTKIDVHIYGQEDTYCNGLGSGTNYKAGLISSKTLLESTRDDATTIVIFVSDGDASNYYDDDGWTLGNGTGTLGSENAKVSFNAAIPQLQSMYEDGNIDYFMTVGVGPTNSYTNLVNLAYLLEYGTNYDSSELEDRAEYIKTQYKVTASFYEGSDETSLNSAFDNILETIKSITGITGVTISDTLSENVSAVKYSYGVNKYVNLTINVTDVNGYGYAASGTFNSCSLELSDGTVITASYDTSTKTIKLNFPKDYQLIKGYTYSVTLTIEPTEKAYDNYYDSSGYPNTGDLNTDAPGVDSDNYISSGKGGVYTNADGAATLTYTYYGSSRTKDYAKPVIPLHFTNLTIQKYGEDGTPLSGAKFILSRENSSGETVYYHYDDSAGLTSWVSDKVDATELTSSDSDGTLTFYNLFSLRLGSEAYSLEETETPKGYEGLESAVGFSLNIPTWLNYTLTLSGTYDKVAINNTDLQLLITNEKIYYELPSKGGMGTAPYTLAGLVLAGGAAGMMCRRRKHPMLSKSKK
ncbi:MAG: hypothetical protein LUC60_09565 [Lachnospiraceae bacterium]|nr:hypothetical protein [Lachnospiraceae bacterium]